MGEWSDLFPGCRIPLLREARAATEPAMTQFENRKADWLSVEEALARILAQADPLETEAVRPLDALGRALAEPVSAAATLPPWDNSAMDGYAVRATDVAAATLLSPAILRVSGEIRAGDPGRIALSAGEAVRIMTGAPLPAGADAIVRVEDTDAEAEAGLVRVFSAPPKGKDIRPGGQDMKKGDQSM